MVKKDGEGEFYNSTTKTWKKGLWKEGKRVTWLDNNANNAASPNPEK